MESARQRLKNLLIILLESIATGSQDLFLDRKHFQDLVAAAGYDEADISTILDWLETQWQPVACSDWGAAQDLSMSDGMGVRLFGADESLWSDSF